MGKQIGTGGFPPIADDTPPMEAQFGEIDMASKGPASMREGNGVTKLTPAARWRENGEPDPFGDSYDTERSQLCGGHMTDDEVANEVYLNPGMANLTAAKDRIRWLSRALTAAILSATTPGDSDAAG